jgi:hypothetical protein
VIKVNLEKARQIGHDIRRKTREIEFGPHDALIAKQIPGAAEAAEAERQKIREKYAIIQSQIDSAQNVDSLLTIVKGMKS